MFASCEMICVIMLVFMRFLAVAYINTCEDLNGRQNFVETLQILFTIISTYSGPPDLSQLVACHYTVWRRESEPTAQTSQICF